MLGDPIDRGRVAHRVDGWLRTELDPSATGSETSEHEANEHRARSSHRASAGATARGTYAALERDTTRSRTMRQHHWILAISTALLASACASTSARPTATLGESR